MAIMRAAQQMRADRCSPWMIKCSLVAEWPVGDGAATTPSFGQQDGAHPDAEFAFDDDVDDDVPILRLGDEEEEQQAPIPTFRLDDNDEVDDDVPSRGRRPPPSPNDDGPGLQFESELENQMPQPLARPASELPT